MINVRAWFSPRSQPQRELHFTAMGRFMKLMLRLTLTRSLPDDVLRELAAFERSMQPDMNTEEAHQRMARIEAMLDRTPTPDVSEADSDAADIRRM